MKKEFEELQKVKKRKNKLIQDNNHGQLQKQDRYSWLLIPMLMFICYTTMIFIRLTTNKVEPLYIKSNYGLFFLSFVIIFYHVILSLLKINLFKDYIDFITSLKKINFKVKSKLYFVIKNKSKSSVYLTL